MGLAKYILAADHDIAKFAISEIGIFCTDISTDIFTCTNNLMHCLIVTVLCCVDDHFTSFIAVLLLLPMAMVYSEFCRVLCAVPRKTCTVCHGSAIDIGFFLVINIMIRYQKNMRY